MPAGEAKDKNMIKSRMVILAQMFYEHTDQEHPMTGQEILEYLREHGVPANEKTLRGDIRLLKDLGLDIVKIVSRPNLFYWGERQFEMPELKLLVDAVSSSRFITKKKSHALTKKLTQLSSEYQRKELRRNIQATNRVKSENESIYYSVNTVNEAISRRKKIRFQYTEFGPDLKETLRGDGEVYELSPYALLWNEDYYYVVGWSDKHGNVSVFRTDRLSKVEILVEDAVPEPEDFNLEDYSRKVFEMFDGEEVDVVLECKNEFMKYIIDRFGEDVDTDPISRTTFEARVRVALSPTFYAWVFTFEGGIRIVSPEKAVEDIVKMAKKLVKAERK